MVQQLHAGDGFGGIHQLEVERLAADDAGHPFGIVGTGGRLGRLSAVHEVVLEPCERVVCLVAVQVGTVPPHHPGLELAQLLAELADGEIDGLMLIDARHRGPHVVTVAEQRHLHLLALGNARVLLLPEHHLGPIQVADESVERPDLAFHRSPHIVGNLNLATGDGDLHCLSFLGGCAVRRLPVR